MVRFSVYHLVNEGCGYNYLDMRAQTSAYCCSILYYFHSIVQEDGWYLVCIWSMPKWAYKTLTLAYLFCKSWIMSYNVRTTAAMKLRVEQANHVSQPVVVPCPGQETRQVALTKRHEFP